MRKLSEWFLITLLYPVFYLARYLNRKQAEERPFCLVDALKTENGYIYKYALYKNNYYELTVLSDNPFIWGRNIIDSLEINGIFNEDFKILKFPTPSGIIILKKCSDIEIETLYGKPNDWQKNLESLLKLTNQYMDEYSNTHKDK